MPTPLTHDDPRAFGPYRPVARLGSGGMGTVYLARSPGGRTVAIKTMHARIASDTGFRTRFRLEADAARVIGGRHGAEVVDADPLAETPWLATEYVLGPPLDDAVELAGPLPETSVRALGAALCSALGQLHRSDVVHRDLKPSNILVTAYGPKVIDFGIARAIGDDRLTSTGAAVGTPAFMSPEQATGQEHSPAGDVFALAGVLVFAATGQGPFGHGQAADLLYRVRYGEPDLTRVPPALVAVLAPCLDKDPARRPTTGQLAARLHDGSGDFADHLPDAVLAEIARRASEVWGVVAQRLPAPPAEADTAVTAPAAGTSRRRLLLAGGGTALGAAAAGAGAWAWSRSGGSGTEGSQGQADPGPSNSVLPRKKLDSLWQRQVAGPPDDTVPAAPLAVGDLVTLVVGTGLAGLGAKKGTVAWVSDQTEMTWKLAVDGDRLLRMLAPEGSVGNAGKTGGFPMTLASVDLATGKAGDPFARFTDFNGVIEQNQVLCAGDGVVYLAGGAGEYSMDGFLATQSWSLCAVDVGSGRKLWSSALPPRPEGSYRLYFVSAKVVGDHLVTLQETNSGAVQVVVRDAGTGAVRWQRALSGAGPEKLRIPLATDEHSLYLGVGGLRALRLADGKQVWDSASERPGKTYGPPAVKDGVVYAVEKGLGLVAFDSGSGQARWEEKGGGGAKADLTAAPVIGTDHAYSKRSSLLWGIDLSSRTPALSYKTTGERFIAHEKAGVVIALGGKFLAAYPLK
ncbi:PQQ-binding-like beta-propeller repeat protein [Streptomyces sp. NPDC059786]|uniref:serine/threonine-protein kinase n=1 Tax=Streptomyces sp. NPDC059786 TaxID=3346946 RepID=UPI00364E0600